MVYPEWFYKALLDSLRICPFIPPGIKSSMWWQRSVQTQAAVVFQENYEKMCIWFLFPDSLRLLVLSYLLKTDFGRLYSLINTSLSKELPIFESNQLFFHSFRYYLLKKFRLVVAEEHCFHCQALTNCLHLVLVQQKVCLQWCTF